MFDLGHGAACYCHGSSLSRKESGKVFVVPLQLDSFVPVRDIVILKIMRILTSECVCGDARRHFWCPYVPLLGDNNKRPESSNHRLCPGVSTTLLGADEHEVHTHLFDVQSLRTSMVSTLFWIRQNKVDTEKYEKRRDLGFFFLTNALYPTCLYDCSSYCRVAINSLRPKCQGALHRTLRVRCIKRCRDVANNGTGNLDGLP